MKNLNILLLPAILLGLVSCPLATASGPAGRQLQPAFEATPFVSLEKLEAEYFPASKVVAVKGGIKNTSRSAMRGYLTLYLLSSGGEVLSAIELPVNDHRPFRDGESVAFDTAVNVSNISGAYRVSVEFTRD